MEDHLIDEVRERHKINLKYANIDNLINEMPDWERWKHKLECVLYEKAGNAGKR